MLETILAIRFSLGESFSEGELTDLLRTTLLSEAGFGFLTLCGGFVTLTVPEQDLKRWYPEQRWLAPEKEMTAQAIAQKYELSLSEPIDMGTGFWGVVNDPLGAHHHIELRDRRQTVIIAHPRYLKVRVLGSPERYQEQLEARCLVDLGPEILQDLSVLYG